MSDSNEALELKLAQFMTLAKIHSDALDQIETEVRNSTLSLTGFKNKLQTILDKTFTAGEVLTKGKP